MPHAVLPHAVLPHAMPTATVAHGPMQMPGQHRDLGHPHFVQGWNDALTRQHARRHRFEGEGIGLWNVPAYSYGGDVGQPSPPQLAAGDDFAPTFVPFERPACVRPLIIQIKPMQHASRLPRVLYGRPLVC
jgi:hypothetical protein